MFLIISILLRLTTQQSLTFQSKLFGYDANQQQCILGVADCSSQLPKLLCEFGFFLFKDPQGLNNCLPCPYFLNPDSLGILCGDCLEDPYNWQNSRQCTYNYRIVTGDPSNTYLRVNITTTVYFIQEMVTNGIKDGRKIAFKYSLSICDGCNSLCSTDGNTDEIDETVQTDEINYDENYYDEGNTNTVATITQTCGISIGQDIIYNGIMCNDGYYYSSAQCLQCSSNCKSCTETSCVTCNDGYYLSSDNQCSICNEGCNLCQYIDDQQICTQCSTTTYFQIQSLDFQNCEACEYLCSRCEYVSYNTDWAHYATRDQYSYSDLTYIKRCRICESNNYIISPYGQQCERCEIDQCQLCYYELQVGTTLEYDFIPSQPKGGQKCQICKDGYTLIKGTEKDICQPLTDQTNHCVSAKIDDLKCTSCKNNNVLNLSANICESIECTSKIKNCQICYSDIKDFGDTIVGQEKLTYYQCIQCDPGYYVDIFSGTCVSCPKNCKTCKQYTDSYDFSRYLQTLQPITDQDLNNFISEPLKDLLCTECADGFSLFGNTCMGCTGNCYYYDESDGWFYSACYEDEEKAFCYRCLDSKQSQSLTSDLSECYECAQFCSACRDRVDTDPIVNPYFSPSSDQLLMYGKLCYKLRTDIDEQIAMINKPDATSILANVFLDNKLGLPVQCFKEPTDTSTKKYKCYNSYSITLKLACDSSIKNIKQLSTFSAQKTSIILIKFNEDSYTNYVLFNQMAIRELNIQLELLGSTCSFNRETKFQFQFLQNVFSLNKVNLNIQSDTSEQLWETSGIINFEGLSSVSINDIIVQYKKLKGIAQFGFSLKSNDETQFLLSKVQFTKEEKSALQIYLENPINITLQDVKFSYLDTTDKVMSLNYSKSLLSYQDFKLINVVIDTFFLNNTNFLEFSNKASSAVLLIQNLKIVNGYMHSNSLIISNNPQCNLIATISNVQILQSSFQNTKVFYLSNLQKSGQFLGIDSVQNIFNQSTLFLLNSFQISKVYVSYTALYNESKLMMTVNEIKTNDLIKSSIQSFVIDSIKIVNSKCFSLNCLIVMETPVNQYSIVSSLDIKNMELNNVVISDITQREVLLTTSALIKLTNLAIITLNNIVIDNVIGITIFQIQQIAQLSVSKFRYDWSQSNQIGSLINPTNNLIATSPECANRKLASYAFTYIVFFIYQFTTSISFNDIQIQRQLLLDASFIHIQSYDVAYFNTTVGKTVEQIQFNNIRFFNNSIMSNTKGLFSGCIYIESNQIQIISIKQINFQSTHLQQLISKQIVRLSVLFKIISPKGNTTINNLQSDYNRAISCQEGLIIISCYSFILNQASFKYTNIQNKNWLSLLEPNQLSSDDDALAFFEILSQGTLMEITMSQGSLNDIFVNYTYGVQPGFKIITLGSSQILMQNIYMANIFGNLELKFSSMGGGLYIDSGFSSLNLTIFNISMFNSRVRQAGGCIYLMSSNKKQSITIQSSVFYRCQALESSFMYVEFNVDAYLQEVELNNVQIANNSMINLLTVTPQIQTFEELYFLQTGSVYTQKNGRLIIVNSDISNMKYQSIFQLTTIRLLSINGLRITDSILFYTPTIQLSLLQSGAQVYIGNMEIIQMQESFAEADSTADCSNLIMSSFTYNYQAQDCDTINAIQEQLDELTQDDEIYAPWDELYDETYLQLKDSQKYTPKDINTISKQTTSSIYQILDYQSENLIRCLLSSILYLAQQLNLDQFSSFFYLNEVTDNHQLSLKKISFTQNYCLKCTGGIMQIRQISDTNTQQLIQIEEFYCRYNIIGYYGCATFINQDSITFVNLFTQIIDHSVDSNNRLLQSDNITTLNHTLLISDYDCNDNSAKAGTCLNINGVTTIVMNSQFSSNKASLVGGAVYFVNTGNNNFYQTQNQYINNFAQEGGGIYLVNYQLSDTEKENVNFDKNTASGGAVDVQESTISQTIQLINIPFSSAVYLNFSGDSNDDGSIDNASVIIRDNVSLSYSVIGNYPDKTNLLILPSGIKIQNYSYYYEATQEQIPFEWIFRVINLNRFGDPVKNGLPTDMCTIDGRIQNFNTYDDTLQFTNNFTVPSKVNYNQDKGGFDMDELVLTFDPKFNPNYYLELRFVCNSVTLPIYNVNPPYQIIGQNTNYELLARVRTFPCQIGEAYDSEQCKACQKSQLVYSVVPDSIQCKQMNRLTMKDVSPIGIDLLHGFWRPNYKNDNIESCSNLANNCNGGWVPADPSCYTGHLGALCESCDIYQIDNEEKWASSGAYKCGKCSDTEKYNVAIIVAISILTMISTITSVKGTYESLQLQIVQETIALFNVRLKSDSSNLATMVQTLTNYFQIVQIVMTFQLQIPSGVSTATQTAGNPTGSMAYSLDCLLIKISDTPVLYFKMIWALVMPLLYLGAIIFGYLFICIFGLTKFNSSIIYTAIIYMFLYLHPTVVQGFISQASVRTVSGLPYVKADVAYRYDSPQHAYWMARFIGPMLGIWVIGLPCLFMYLVWRKRLVLNTKSTRMKLGYFYRQYQPNSYLWEFVKIFQKEFFVIILVYYEEFVIIKGLLIVLVLFLYGWYQVSVSPFGSQKLNNTDRYSTMVCAATLCLGVLMYGAQLKNYYYMQVIILLILAFLNLWFIIKCLMQIFDGYLIKFQDQLDMIREKVIASNPELKTRKGTIGKLLIHRGNMNKRVKYLWEVYKQKTMMAVKITKLANNVSFEEAFQYIIENNVQENQIPKVTFRNQQEFEKLPESR